MAHSLNIAQLIGNLGSDPEVRSTQGGQRVASFSMATSEEWKNKEGEKQEKTQWHRVIAWGKLADIIEEYVKKGDKVYVQGRIEYRQWDDKDGNKRYSTEIVIDKLIMLGSPSGKSGGSSARGTVDRATRGKAEQREDDFEEFPGALQDEDDDLPF